MLGFMTEGCPMSRTMSAFLRDEAGGAMILAAVILPIGLAAVGAAVTYSNVSATRVSYQKALDGAVLAGTILPASASVAERIKAAEVVFAAGITGQVQSVTVASSTRFKVDTLGSDDVKVTGEASAEVKNLFGVIGGETIAIAVHSAGRKGQSEPVCLMALNGKEQGAVDLNGTVDVATNCPVQANSTDGAAVRQVGNAAMTSSMFAIAGNYRGSNFSPKPVPAATASPIRSRACPFRPPESASTSALAAAASCSRKPGRSCPAPIAAGSTSRRTARSGLSRASTSSRTAS